MAKRMTAENAIDTLRACKPWEQQTSDFDEYKLDRKSAINFLRVRDKATLGAAAERICRACGLSTVCLNQSSCAMYAAILRDEED